jgi:hypothetical protein
MNDAKNSFAVGTRGDTEEMLSFDNELSVASSDEGDLCRHTILSG